MDYGPWRVKLTGAHPYSATAYASTFLVFVLRSICSVIRGLFLLAQSPHPNPEHLGVQIVNGLALGPQPLAQSLEHHERLAYICRMNKGFSGPSVSLQVWPCCRETLRCATDSPSPPGPLSLLSPAALEFPAWGVARSLLMKVGKCAGMDSCVWESLARIRVMVGKLQ